MGQVIQAGDRDTLETVVLWLMLLEALLVPHLLWILSDRYRHAVSYTWKVFVLQDKNAKEEDAAACTLQSYKVKAKPVQPKALRNGGPGLQGKRVKTGQLGFHLYSRSMRRAPPLSAPFRLAVEDVLNDHVATMCYLFNVFSPLILADTLTIDSLASPC